MMTDLDTTPTSMLATSDSFQLTFCFCLFGFFGTIIIGHIFGTISTSYYLHWSHNQTNICDNYHKPKSEITNVNYSRSNDCTSTNRITHINHHNNYKHPHYQRQHQQQPSQNVTSAYSQQQQCKSLQSPQQVLVARYHPRQQQIQQRQQQQKQYYPQHHQPQQQQKCFNYVTNLCSNSTQIILDWDDTLFPTAYTLINLKNGINSSSLICDEEWDELNQLKNSVLYILLMFIQYFGSENITIVTNARMDWFNESCKIYKKLYGEIKNLLVNKYKIPIISAHDTYSRQKSSAFMNVLQHKHNINKVLCFGDSSEEYDACHHVCSALNIRERSSITPQRGQDINYYRFKLIESPSVNAMIKQLQFIKTLDYYTISKQSFDSSYHFK